MDPAENRLLAIENRLSDLEAFNRGTGYRNGLISHMASAEADASLFLQREVAPQHYIPAAGGWAAPYQLIAYVVSHILNSSRSLNIIEFGTGISTVWFASAIRRRGAGKLFSIEQDAAYAELTAGLLAESELGPYVDLRTAPLKALELNGVTTAWYETDIALGQIPSIDMVVVDGPTGSSSPRSRYPAVPMVQPSLRDGAKILLDDAQRPEERAILNDWQELPTAGTVKLIRHLGRTALLQYSTNGCR